MAQDEMDRAFARYEHKVDLTRPGSGDIEYREYQRKVEQFEVIKLALDE